MSDYFLGEIRLFAFSYAPEGWHICDGTQLPVQQNAALYSLLGNQFGGSYPNNFNLPDLRGRTPVHLNQGISDNTHVLTGAVGSSAGVDAVTLANNQVPDHNHPMYATTTTGTQPIPASPVSGAGNIPATPGHSAVVTLPVPIYIKPGQSTARQTLTPAAVSTLGAAVAHENRQPYLAATYCISTIGLYPNRPD